MIRRVSFWLQEIKNFFLIINNFFIYQYFNKSLQQTFGYFCFPRLTSHLLTLEEMGDDILGNSDYSSFILLYVDFLNSLVTPRSPCDTFNDIACLFDNVTRNLDV